MCINPLEYELILFLFLLTTTIKASRAMCAIFEENGNWETNRKISL